MARRGRGHASVTVCGVHEGREVREGDGRRPHHSTPRRSEAVLGPGQLAGAVSSVPFEKDWKAGSASEVSVLKLL